MKKRKDGGDGTEVTPTVAPTTELPAADAPRIPFDDGDDVEAFM